MKFLSCPTTVWVRAVLSVVQKKVHTLLRAHAGGGGAIG